MRRRDPWLPADLTAKAVLAALLLFALVHNDWARFSDKAMVARAVAYPTLVGSIPAVWLVVRRRRPVAYPSLLALLVTVPFVVDIAGNALDLYDRVDHFDDVCHFVNWAILASAAGIGLLHSRALPPAAIAGLCSGLGAVTAILWELGEYGAFITHTPERFTLYRDTMGDLALGLAGSTLAGLVCAWVAHRDRISAAAASPAPARP